MRLFYILSLTLLLTAANLPKWADAATFTLSPVKDVYVHSWVDLADTNFGNETAIVTACDYGSWLVRTYLMFDLSVLPEMEHIIEATLYLYQYDGMGYGSSGVLVHHLSNDTWDEGTITWNNRPDGGVYGDEIAYNPNGGWQFPVWSSWDLMITGVWDPSGDKADGFLSLLLKEMEGGDQGHCFYSKEYTEDPNLQPYLQIITSPVVATPDAHDFGNIEVGCTAEQSFMIENQGSQPFEINTIDVTGVDADDFFIQNDGCSGQALLPSGSCTFDTVYEPDSTGIRNAEITISLTDPEIDTPNIPLTADSREVCEGDFDNDGDVDSSDLSIFAADFGRTDCAGDCEGDFDGDGDVDGSDLAVFAADFGRTDCPVCP